MSSTEEQEQHMSATTTTETPSMGPIPELDALGVRYSMEWGQARSKYIRQVRIPWTPIQWCGVVHREGEWLGTCCGTISAIRDRLIQVLADGGWVDHKGLARIVELMASHDGFDEWFEPKFTPTEDTLTNPLYLLAQVWQVVKGRRWASWMEVPQKLTAEKQVERSGRSLEHALMLYNYLDLYHTSPYPDQTQEEKDRNKFRHERDLRQCLSRVVPALRMFTESLKDKATDPLPGVAIVAKSNRDVVLDTNGGPAIYGTLQEASEIVAFWCTNDQEQHGEPPPKPEDYEFRDVTVTIENGLVFV